MFAHLYDRGISNIGNAMNETVRVYVYARKFTCLDGDVAFAYISTRKIAFNKDSSISRKNVNYRYMLYGQCAARFGVKLTFNKVTVQYIDKSQYDDLRLNNYKCNPFFAACPKPSQITTNNENTKNVAACISGKCAYACKRRRTKSHDDALANT